jgi:intracellular sulfur oxidation DsrE/DsrF family protein
MHAKSQTRFILQSFINLMETQFQTQVKCLCTYSGIEFIMTDLYASK